MPEHTEYHVTIAKSKSLPRTVKTHEVHTVATSLQLFNKVYLQTMMKAGRWSSRGTFTSFNFRDLFSQADNLRKAGALVPGRRVVVTSTY